MPAYRIIGSDLKEYGPVDEEQIRKWLADGRADSDTKIQVEGDPEWKRLADLPEFVAPVPKPRLVNCPGCGEKFEDGFDSCWKCGTKRDGSPPTVARELFDEAKTLVDAAPIEPCPKCGGNNVTAGEILPSKHSSLAMFKPQGSKFLGFSIFPGVALASNPSFACLDCGMVWDYANPEELKEFISTNCTPVSQPDAYQLLAEAVRLEAEGNVVAAFAKYEAIKERFPGTDAAKDAEASIRILRKNLL